jgi:hypothetical protein
LVSLPTVQNSDQVYRVFLPVRNAPAQTPEQISGQVKPLTALDPALWSGEAKNGDNKKGDENKPEARKRPEHARRRHRR